MAIERACNMLENYASGRVLDGMLEYNTLDRKEKVIEITLDKINSVLGYKLKVEDVKGVFDKLNFVTEVNKKTFKVTVPTRRIDISIPEDLIEEVSRVYGLDNLESTLPLFESTPSKHDNRTRIIREEMVSLGLNEVITYSLINVDDIFKFTNDEFGLIKVLAPLNEERCVLRHSLITSLLEVYKYNKARNIKDVSIFEIGRGFSLINGEYIEENKLACLLTGSYTEGLNKEYYDFYVVKGLVENLLDDLGYQNRYSFVVKEFPEEMHPTKSVYINVNGKVVGLFGQVHPRISKDEIYTAIYKENHTVTWKLSETAALKQAYYSGECILEPSEQFNERTIIGWDYNDDGVCDLEYGELNNTQIFQNVRYSALYQASSFFHSRFFQSFRNFYHRNFNKIRSRALNGSIHRHTLAERRKHFI